MATTNVVFNNYLALLLDGFSLTSQNVKVMLVGPLFVPNADNVYVSEGGSNDAVDHEINVSGYTAGWGSASRKPLASKTAVPNTTTDRGVFDAGDLTWATVGGSVPVRWAVAILEGVSDDTTSKLLFAHDLRADPVNFPAVDRTTNGQDFIVQWAATGLINTLLKTT